MPNISQSRISQSHVSQSRLSRRAFLGGTAAAVAGLSLAGPGGAQAQGAPRKVRIATLPTIILFPTYVARDLGIYKDLNIEPEFVIARGGSEILQLMLAGAAEVANAGVEHVFKLREGGMDTRVLTVQEGRYITELVVNNKLKDKVRTLKDLKGMSIGVSGMGSGSHICSRYILKDAGLDPETDVSFIAVGGPSTQVKAFQSGQIDVLMAFDPAQSILKYQDKIAYKLWSGTAGDPPAIFQDFAMECLAAPVAWIAKNKDLAGDVVKANVAAIDRIRAGDPRVLDVYAAMFPGVPRDVLRKSLNEHLAAFTPVVTEQGIKNVNAYGRFAGVTTRDFTYKESFATEYEDLWRNWKAPSGQEY